MENTDLDNNAINPITFNFTADALVKLYNELVGSSAEHILAGIGPAYHGLLSLIVQLDDETIIPYVKQIRNYNEKIINHRDFATFACGRHQLRYQPKCCFNDIFGALLMNSSVVTPAIKDQLSRTPSTSPIQRASVHFVWQVAYVKNSDVARGHHLEVVFISDDKIRVLSSIIDPDSRPGAQKVMPSLFPGVSQISPPSSAFEYLFSPVAYDPKIGSKNMILCSTEETLDATFSNIIKTSMQMNYQPYKNTAAFSFMVNDDQYQRIDYLIRFLDCFASSKEYPSFGIHTGANCCGQLALEVYSLIVGQSTDTGKTLSISDTLHLIALGSSSISWCNDAEISLMEFIPDLIDGTVHPTIDYSEFCSRSALVTDSPGLKHSIAGSRSSFCTQYEDFKNFPEIPIFLPLCKIMLRAAILHLTRRLSDMDAPDKSDLILNDF